MRRRWTEDQIDDLLDDIALVACVILGLLLVFVAGPGWR